MLGESKHVSPHILQLVYQLDFKASPPMKVRSKCVATILSFLRQEQDNHSNRLLIRVAQNYIRILRLATESL